jgi:hypothetical protein
MPGRSKNMKSNIMLSPKVPKKTPHIKGLSEDTFLARQLF